MAMYGWCTRTINRYYFPPELKRFQLWIAHVNRHNVMAWHTEEKEEEKKSRYLTITEKPERLQSMERGSGI